jgi:hypothetical protein
MHFIGGFLNIAAACGFANDPSTPTIISAGELRPANLRGVAPHIDLPVPQ